MFMRGKVCQAAGFNEILGYGKKDETATEKRKKCPLYVPCGSRRHQRRNFVKRYLSGYIAKEKNADGRWEATESLIKGFVRNWNKETKGTETGSDVGVVRR